MLGDIVDILQTEIKSLRQENQQLSEDTIRWKNTADKLVDQWQTEKNELTESFLVLFNEHKARHVATRKELEELKSNENNLPIGTVSSKQISRREADILPDNEDEHDHATWSDNLVKRLAAGPNKSRRGSREIDRYKSEEKEEASAARPASTSEGTFVNPHTGVLEISNYKRMFDSDDDSDSPPKKKKTCDC
jgi:FtsZ-binding cell division protein ZapB